MAPLRYFFCNGQRGCDNFKIVYISNYSQFMSEGVGFIKSLFFLNSKQTTLSLGRGKGVKKIFPLFVTFFSSDCIPKFLMVIRPMLTFL